MAAVALIRRAAGARAMRRRDRRRQHGRPLLMFPIRIALVGVMGVALALLAGRAFDQIVPGLLLPPVVIAFAAAILRRLRAVVRIVVAGALVLLTTALAGVVEGGGGGGFLDDAAAGPRRLFTTEWPSPLDRGVIVALALFVALITAVAADLAGRPSMHLAPLAAIALGFAGVLAVAAPVHASWWALLVMGVAAALFVFARPGDDPRTRVRLLLAERSLAATVVGLVTAGIVTSSAIAWNDRVDPRRDVEAELSIALLEPIEQVTALRRVDPPIDLFSITDRSTVVGPSLPIRWRTAALDQYDGQRWLPAVTLRPIGERLGRTDEAPTGPAPPIRYEVEVLTDDIDLVPLPGEPHAVDVADDTVIETDRDRTVVRLSETPQPGLVIDVTADLAPVADAGTSVATLQVDAIADGFTNLAEELDGDGTVVERLRSIESAMRGEGWRLNRNAAGPGLQLKLIDIFVNETRTGTPEQFVTAFVLLARSIGVDARVATGFVVQPDELASPLVLRSTDAAVWPEVNLGELGWLAFDPVPARETTEPEADTPPPSEQSPAAAQPPAPEPPERDTEPEAPVDIPIEDDAEWGTVQVWAARVAVGSGVVLLPLLGVIGTIVLLKARRRRRRLAAPDPARRIVGAWANATDSLVDAGLTIGPSWTDDHIAEQATTIAPAVPHDMRRLAYAATAMTFGATERSAALVDDAVTTSRSVDQAIRADLTLLQRMRWRLSTRSLRKRTRSPVDA